MSREIDAEVAEKVMGWADIRPYFTGGPFGVNSFEGKRGKFDEEKFWRDHPGSKESGGGINRNVPVEVPNYSTDISAAFQIVDSMEDAQFKLKHWVDSWRLPGEEDWHKKSRWEAEFEGIYAGGNTAAEAICNAALCLAALRASKEGRR